MPLGGPRKLLKRLDPDKEIKGLSGLKFGRALLNSPPIWPSLDFRWDRADQVSLIEAKALAIVVSAKGW
jgi:hypothetical protein